MTDIVDKQTRSRMMSNIQSTDTKPEMAVRRILYRAGLRYRLHVPTLPGKPDIVMQRYKLCIFVHGCFWHRHSNCNYASTPATRGEFWQKKFTQNSLRDRAAVNALKERGWRVFILWECGIKKQSIDWLPSVVASTVNSLEWPQLNK